MSPENTVPTEAWEFPIDNGFVVVRPDVPLLFSLNRTASVIWTAYRETGSENRAAEILAATFNISLDLATKDVLATLNCWASAGLLGPIQSATPREWNGRHGEASVVAYCSIEGTRFLLLTDSQAVMAELAPRLAGVRVEACKPDVTLAVWGCADDCFAIVVGEECIGMEQGVRTVRAVLFQELVRRAQPGREWLALLHAGACGIDGRCVLFPASSYSGKSTLAAALMASGFTLYSDDFVGVTAGSLRIPAMPFTIPVRSGSWDVLRSWIPDIDNVSALEICGEQIKFLDVPQPNIAVPGNAVAIVFSEWAAATDVSIHSLSTADVIGRLNESGFWVRHDRASISAFLAWLHGLPKYELRYSDLKHAVGHVSALTERHRSK